jgi:hypothetical protein
MASFIKIILGFIKIILSFIETILNFNELIHIIVIITFLHFFNNTARTSKSKYNQMREIPLDWNTRMRLGPKKASSRGGP